MLFGRLDDLREQTSRRLAKVLLESGGTPQARSERDTATAMHSSDLAQYSAVENGLCFGRLDFDDGEHQHIGRIDIFRTEGDYEPLLMDWRAAAAATWWGSTTRCWTWPRPCPAGTRAWSARRPCWPRSAPAAPAG